MTTCKKIKTNFWQKPVDCINKVVLYIDTDIVAFVLFSMYWYATLTYPYFLTQVYLSFDVLEENLVSLIHLVHFYPFCVFTRVIKASKRRKNMMQSVLWNYQLDYLDWRLLWLLDQSLLTHVWKFTYNL